MTRLGVRLAFAGGKEAVARLALIAVAVAIGVGLLLTTVAGINALDAQDQRYAWLATGYPNDADSPADLGTDASHGSETVDPLWWWLRGDYFQGDEISRVDVAATGAESPVPPGIPALPRPGEYYVSPALDRLLADTPAAQLGDRFAGTQIGIIGSVALPSPDSLTIIIGRDVDELERQDGARLVSEIGTTPPSECSGACAPVGIDASGMTLVLSVVAAALLFPILIFIGGATRLSAARREERFAAMRLVGATPRQISTLASVESSLATTVGGAVGFGFFFALRPVVAAIPFSGDRFFVSDLSLSGSNVLLIAIGVPVAAAVAARLALRRVIISPLGVSRRVSPSPPRAWRLGPMVAGAAWLGYLAFFSDLGEGNNSSTQAYAYLLGVFSIMIGLTVAGPWLTMTGSRFMSRRAERPAGLIAARRLGDNPQAAFRSISGLVIAVFVASVSIGTMATIVAYNDGAAGDSAQSTDTVIHRLSQGEPGEDRPAEVTPADLEPLTSIPGVESTALIHVRETAGLQNPDGRFDVEFFFACADMARNPILGRCPSGAETVSVIPTFGRGVVDTSTAMADITWPAADLAAAEISALPVNTIVVSTDGSSAAIETARTALEELDPTRFGPQTLSEFNAHNSATIGRYQQLANVVLLTSLPIAGCSLAVSMAGGLAERRRPFRLLRLTGVPLATLRRVVALEAAVPLLSGVVVSAGAGLLAAALFLRSQLDQTLQAPGLSYYLLLGGGLVASLAIITSTMPLLARMTAPEAARNE